MTKLIRKFEATGTLKAAQKLVDHDRRHPFASCLLDTYDQTWLQVAIDMVEKA